MQQYSFRNDYAEGAHPSILEALTRTNLEQQEGYGEDKYCQKAANLIRGRIGNADADIHFTSGGTQANLTIIASILKPYESVISASTGHIAVHEAGAIEATGHKVNTIDTNNGKLSPDSILDVLNFHTDEHMVKPRLVYISNTTEVGSVYTKQELEALSVFCQQKDLTLYLDGARLGSALTSTGNNLTLAELSNLVDVLYIGGTKNGALLGEAIVINNHNIKRSFRFNLKQKGALLAKGRIFGIQFTELFTDNLFFELGAKANSMARLLAEGIMSMGLKFLSPPISNQIFPILPNGIIDSLAEKYGFYIWQKTDNEHTAIRLVTSWATKEEHVEGFIRDMKLLMV